MLQGRIGAGERLGSGGRGKLGFFCLTLMIDDYSSILPSCPFNIILHYFSTLFFSLFFFHVPPLSLLPCSLSSVLSHSPHSLFIFLSRPPHIIVHYSFLPCPILSFHAFSFSFALFCSSRDRGVLRFMPALKR